MSNRIILESIIPAVPEKVYTAWLDGNEHARMTGAPAKGSAIVGEDHSAWDGYITGKNLEMEPFKLIIQSWRTSDFKDENPDSILEIKLELHTDGCKLLLNHSEIPDDQPDYESGWEDHYFKPMREYFRGQEN